MNKSFKIAVTASLLALASVSTSIQAKEVNAWKHCGLGAMVFNDNETAAAVSNLIWDLGTTALSSKMSSVESCEGDAVKTAMFIKETFEVLEPQVAIGEGDYVQAMLEVRSCDATATDVRSEYATSEKGAEALFNAVEAACTKA